MSRNEKHLIINAVKVEEKKKLKPRHWEFFDEVAPSVLNLAKRESGKTTVTCHLLPFILEPGKTKLIIFASTLNHDDIYKKITQIAEEKDCEVIAYTSLYGDDDKENILQELCSEIDNKKDNEEEDDESDSEEEGELKTIGLPNYGNNQEPRKKPKKRKLRYDYCKYLVIFDDISTEMRKNPYVTKIIKEGRHAKIFVIVSTQFIHDLAPKTLTNFMYFLLFKSLTKAKVNIIYDCADLNLDLSDEKARERVFYNETEKCLLIYEALKERQEMKEILYDGKLLLYAVYRYLTREPYSFMYLNAKKSMIRNNFFDLKASDWLAIFKYYTTVLRPTLTKSKRKKKI